MIKIFMIGRLGKDCSTNNVNGNNVINFTVARTEKYKTKEGKMQEKTIWADCAYWTEKVGVVPYLKKGVQVYVEGTPDVRAYTTNEGKHGASLTIRVQSVQLLGNKADNEAESNPMSDNMQQKQNPSSANSTHTPSAESDIDDLPF